MQGICYDVACNGTICASTLGKFGSFLSNRLSAAQHTNIQVVTLQYSADLLIPAISWILFALQSYLWYDWGSSGGSALLSRRNSYLGFGIVFFHRNLGCNIYYSSFGFCKRLERTLLSRKALLLLLFRAKQLCSIHWLLVSSTLSLPIKQIKSFDSKIVTFFIYTDTKKFSPAKSSLPIKQHRKIQSHSPSSKSAT